MRSYYRFPGIFYNCNATDGEVHRENGPPECDDYWWVTGLGWLLSSFAGSVEWFYIFYGVIAGTGVGIAYGVPVAVAARWFPDRRGLAVGLTLLGFGFSALITANVAGYLIGASGVMNTFRVFGIAFIILIFILALPLKFPKAEWKPAGWTPPPPKPGQAVTCEFNRGQMLRTLAFYGLWACYFIGCLAGLMAEGIAKPVGTDIGVATGIATILVGIFAVFNGFGRPVFGGLTDRISPRNTAMVSFVLIAFASVLIWQVPTVPVYILAFVILGAALGDGLRLHLLPVGVSSAPAIIPAAMVYCSSLMVQGVSSAPSLQGSSRQHPGHT